MRSNQKLSIMFWLFRQKIDKSNRAPIYIRLTIDGMEKDMSSGRKVEPKHWDEKTKRDRGDSQEARENNKKIDEIRRNLELHFDILRSQYEVVTPTMLKNSFLGKPGGYSKSGHLFFLQSGHILRSKVAT
ncbi:Arm DNA-binding domain-containing protein [Nubsella zeaxanthinifaciens]|uniref:Arm DNA-binding domain-containing protein n=1 Tax=Nubsella zeaxanthinifaciens TaxID=392412 RepID=UPI003D04AEC7